MSDLNYLYVEDDRLSREVMTLFMKDLMGITRFTIFEDSTDFMARVEMLNPPPDVFLLDIHMRPISGFEMLQQLRSHPQFSQEKVYALTASVMNEEVARLRAAGFDGVIGKPINMDRFPDVIEQIQAGAEIWQIT